MKKLASTFNPLCLCKVTLKLALTSFAELQKRREDSTVLHPPLFKHAYLENWVYFFIELSFIMHS